MSPTIHRNSRTVKRENLDDNERKLADFISSTFSMVPFLRPKHHWKLTLVLLRSPFSFHRTPVSRVPLRPIIIRGRRYFIPGVRISFGIVPAADVVRQPLRFRGAPGARLVDLQRQTPVRHAIYRGPSRLHRVLADKKHAIAAHRIRQ